MTLELDCGSDPGAYVLGTLSGAERSAFELHLGTCAACRDEVDLLQSAADALPLLAAPAQPVPAPERRGMSEIRAQAVQQVREASEGIGYGTLDRRVSAPVRRWLARPIPRPAMAGIGALLVAALITFAVSRGPSGVHYVPARTAYPGAQAAVQVDGSRAELLVKGMPSAPRGETYEIWTERAGGAPRPTTALFDVDAAGEAGVVIPHGLDGVSFILVTVEPDGGSRTPHAPVVIAAKLP